MSTRALRYGMVGGGLGAMIGAVHRRAAALDGQASLVAGAFSSDPDRSKKSGAEIGVDPARVYGSYEELFAKEASLPEDQRVQFVSIVTPNDTHFPIAMAALDSGFHVVLDKPATHTSIQARELKEKADATGLECCVTYNYTGNAMVREAAERIANGSIGAVRKVQVEYMQGWLATKLEDTGMKQATWRTDPTRAGLGGALGDIGSHAENLCSFVTGLGIESLAADLSSFVDGRKLDDDGSILLRFQGGAKGTMSFSQVAVGCENDLSIRIYGERGGLQWRQQTPETLLVSTLEEPRQEIVRGGTGTGSRAQAATRIPSGHPEGYLEAFANIYLGAIERIRARIDGSEVGLLGRETPTIADGERGVRFMELAVESSQNGSSWTRWTDG